MTLSRRLNLIAGDINAVIALGLARIRGRETAMQSDDIETSRDEWIKAAVSATERRFPDQLVLMMLVDETGVRLASNAEHNRTYLAGALRVLADKIEEKGEGDE